MICLKSHRLRKLQVIKNNLRKFIYSLKINEMHQQVTTFTQIVQSI